MDLLMLSATMSQSKRMPVRYENPLVGSFMLSLTSAMRATRRDHGRVFHATVLLIAALSMAACAGTGAVHAPIVVIDSTPTAQSTLRSILLSGKSGSESGASSQTNLVLACYKSRNFQPVWTQSAQDLDEVRAVLARAHEQ